MLIVQHGWLKRDKQKGKLAELNRRELASS